MSEASASITIRGSMDYADTSGAIRGWCWSPDEPSVHRTVSIVVDGVQVTTAVCDQPRPGLLLIGIGDGANAFEMVIPDDEAVLREGSMVSAYDSATGILVGEASVVRPAIDLDEPGVESSTAIVGHFDGISLDGMVNGWCWFPDDPGRSAEMVITLDDEPVGAVLAEAFRADLRDAGIGSGYHGFAFDLRNTTLAIGQSVVVAVHEASTWRQIGDAFEFQLAARLDRPNADAGEPVAPGGPVAEGNLDSVNPDGVVTGWCWYPTQPNHHLEVEVRVDDEAACTVTARGYRLDLQQAGIGRGDHGVMAVLPWHSIADKRTARISFHDAATGVLIGEPFILRRRGLVLLDQRVRELEQQVRVLQGRLDETNRMRAAGYDQATRELFETVGAFFTRLADGPAAAGPAGVGMESATNLRGMLDEVTSRLRPIRLAETRQPVATICIDGSASIASLHACIGALQSARIDRVAEIVVLDDGTSEEAALLPTVVRNAIYHHVLPGQTLLSLRNETAMAARGAVVIFLSAEARVTDSWLDTILHTFDIEPRAAMVGAALVREDGMPHHLGLMLDSEGRLHDNRRDDPAVDSHSYMREIDALGDLAYAVRREDFTSIGGFDLGFANGASAVFDMCMRLRQAGRAVLQQPQAVAYMSPAGSIDTTRVVSSLTSQDDDIRRLYDRWVRRGTGQLLHRSSQALGLALVIDTAIPRPEMDAGSVATAAHMRVLRALGYRVVFAAVGETIGDPRERAALLAEGIEVVGEPLYESVADYLDQHGADINLVVIYRHANYRLLQQRLETLAPDAARIFVPCDLHHIREEREQAVMGDDNPLLIADIREHELACINASHITVLHSDVEMDLIRHDTDRARLRLLRWIGETHPPARSFHDRSGICFVGGFGHTPNVDGMLWFVREVMPLLRQRLPSVRLHIVGSAMPDSIRMLATADIVVHGWVKDLRPIFEQVRVAIAPLRFGAGFKGKIPTYLEHGLPVVGTSVALEGTGLFQDDGVLYADSAHDFAAAIVRAHEGETLWSDLSFRAIERCETLYSESAGREVFRGILQALSLPARA